MKTPVRGVVIRAVFVAVAMGTAYVVGLWQWMQLGEADGEFHVSALWGGIGGSDEPGSVTPAKRPEKWKREQAVQAWLSALANSHGDGMFRGMGRLMDQTNRDDYAAIIEQMLKLPAGADRDYALEQLMTYLSSSDPSAAFALLDTVTDPGLRIRISNKIFFNLIHENANLALAELAKLPPGPQRQAAYRSAFESWVFSRGESAKYGPLAGEAALALPAGTERTEALRGVAHGWASWDPQAALDWASKLPETDSAALEQALSEMSQSRPEVAAQYVEKLTDVSARNKAILQISRSWVSWLQLSQGKQDPAAALDWLDQVATGDTYDKAVTGIFSTLVRGQQGLAAAMLEKVTEPSVRETMMMNLADNWGGRDPQAALAWAQTLPESPAGTRAAVARVIVAAWSKKDPQGAAAYGQAAGLGEVPTK